MKPLLHNKRKIVVFGLTLFCAWVFHHPAHAQKAPLFPSLKTANKLYSDENYQDAYPHYKILAEHGDANAQLGLGRLYARGLGVNKDYKTALNYFMQSAAQNNAKAQYEIATSYEKGYGVEKDINKAIEWHHLSANNGYKRSQIRLQQLDENYQAPAANDSPNYKITTALKSQFIGEDNLSLGQDKDSQTAFSLDGNITATYKPIQDIRLQTQIRGVHTMGSAQSNNDDDAQTKNISFIEMRRAWVEFQNLLDIAPLSLTVGRQRFQEERGNWWNRDLDALSLNYNTALNSGFIAIGQNLSKYRLGSDSKLEEDERQRLRILGEVSRTFSNNQTLQARFLYENDYSGLENIGQNIFTDDQDLKDNQLLWLGLRATGSIPHSQTLHYRADLMGVIGTEKTLTAQSTATPDLRRVANHAERDVHGWAFDGALEAKLNTPLKPIFTMGYAYASSAFQQSGLEGNTSRYPESQVNRALRNYGEVLRAELSNIHILNLGLNFPILTASDFNINYFSYWRANNNRGLGTNGIDSALNGNGYYIGQALDLVSTIKLSEEKIFGDFIYDNTDLRFKFGAFRSGDAYGTLRNEMAYKATAEIQMRF